MDSSARERTTMAASAMPSMRTLHTAEPTVDVARAMGADSVEDYETAKREGGVEAVRQAVKNTRLSTQVPTVGTKRTSGAYTTIPEEETPGSMRQRHLEEPPTVEPQARVSSIPSPRHSIASTGPSAEPNTPRRQSSFDPRDQAQTEKNMRQSMNSQTPRRIPSGGSANTSTTEPPKIAGVQGDMDMVVNTPRRQSSFDPRDVAQIKKNIRHSMNSQTPRRSQSGSAEPPKIAGVQGDMDMDQSAISRILEFGTLIDSSKRRRDMESSAISRGGGQRRRESNKEEFSPREPDALMDASALSGGGGTRDMDASAVSRGRRREPNNDGFSSREPLNLMDASALSSGGRQDMDSSASSRVGKRHMNSSAISRGGERRGRGLSQKTTSDASAGAIKAGLRNNTGPTATPGVVRVSHDNNTNDQGDSNLTRTESDARVKAGLKNNKGAVGAIHKDGAKTPSQLTPAESDARVKAGLRNGRGHTGTAAVAGAMAVSNNDIPSGARTCPQDESDARVKAGLRVNRTSSSPLRGTSTAIPKPILRGTVSQGPMGDESSRSQARNQVEADARLKAGLRNNSRPSRDQHVVQVGAVSASNNNLQTATSEGGDADARVKAGLRRPNSGLGGSQMTDSSSDAQIKAGLRNNRPSFLSAGSGSGSDIAKPGLRRAQTPGAVFTTGLQFTQAEIDKFERHYERGMSSAADTEGDDGDEEIHIANDPPARRGLRNSLRDADPAVTKFGMRTSRTSSGPISSVREEAEISIPRESIPSVREEAEIRIPRESVDPEIEVMGDNSSQRGRSAAVLPPPPINATDAALVETTDHTRWDDEGASAKKKRKKFYWVCLFVLVGIVAIVVGVVVSTKSSNDEDSGETESTASTAAPELSGLVDMVPISQVFPSTTLPEVTVKAIRSQRERLPQVQAYNWIIEDPNGRNFTEAQRLQRFALATFYYATNGDQWLEDASLNNWLEYDTHECEWFSVASQVGHTVCNGYQPSSLFDHFDYTALVLTGQRSILHNRVKGMLVPEIGLLKLNVLDLGFQNLRGPIPSELGLLSSNLNRLVLYENDLTGTVPDMLFSFLSDIWLSKNPFEPSSIPTEVGLNTKLKTLLMVDNELTGTLPKELFQSDSGFSVLLLEKNKLEGPIPTQIGLASSLREVQLSKSRYSGQIPSEVGLLRNMAMLDLEANYFGGTLCSELGNLERLTALVVMGNRIEGTLPTELARLRQLQQLKISWKESRMRTLKGPIPMQFFTTPIPADGDGRRYLQEEAGQAELDGSDQSIGSNATAVTGLGEEEAPVPIPTFPHLTDLWIEDTNLNGTIPTTIALMTRLRSIYMGLNRETPPGTLPTELGLLSNTLTVLSIGELKLQSTIPTELGLLTRLTKLNLQDNELTGVFPAELGALQVPPLDWFEVKGNEGLEGSIPSHFCTVRPQGQNFGCAKEPNSGAKANSLCGCHCGPCS